MPSPAKSKALSPARLAAFHILLRVETQGSFAAELLRSRLTASLDTRDAALCTELVMGTLRWRSQLDFASQRFTSGRWEKFDPEVRVALRIGAYQLLRMTRIPARAALAESVEIVKQSRKSSASGLVNAVLRRISELGGEEQLAHLRPPAMADEDWDAVCLAHPAWMLRRWTQRWGNRTARSFAAENNRPPATYVRSNGRMNEAVLIAALHEQGVSAERSSILRRCLTIVEGDVAATSLYRQGELVIQDQASQLVPLLLDVRPGQRLLDICSAPGNKTGLLAMAAGQTGAVIAGDLHVHRLRRWSALPDPAVSAPIHRLALDGTAPLPLRGAFDGVLVDAPCSGTGTLRRNPEIKWRLTPENLHDLSRRQLKLLRHAAAVVRTGGRIVYSTCSLEQEENQQIVEAFLAENPQFALIPVSHELPRLSALLRAPEAALPIFSGDYLETAPYTPETDGFFAAILEKHS